MQGMYLCTYMSDKFNNWLDSEYIDKLNGVGGKGMLDVTECNSREWPFDNS